MLLGKFNKVKKSFGDRLILEIDNLEIQYGEKIGLVGLNGSGKSTLINILIGREAIDSGNVILDKSFSYINQFDEEVEIENSKVFKELKVEEYNEYLSGGEKIKARIAKALSSNARIIIADEPTSNLDMEGIKYLENKLIEYKGAVLLVSHDREFLNKICNKIIEIENGKITEYKGDYSSYLNQKDEKVKRQGFEYEKYVKEKIRLQEAIDVKSYLRDGIRKTPKRFGNSEARLHKMGGQSARKSMENAIKNLESRIEKLEEKEKPIETKKLKIDIVSGKEFYSNYPIEVKDLNLKAGSKELIVNCDFKIRKGKKVALVGNNGVGKTTLINEILNGGSGIKVANKVKIGYFKQNLDILNSKKTILENIKEESSLDETYIRIVLSRFLFRNIEVHKKVDVLSGGEKVRVALCKVILSDNNFLILDEPSNYLDIASMEALEEALINTNKTLIIVSHDRHLIENVCNEVLEIENKKIVQYSYSLNEALKQKNKPNLNKSNQEKNNKLIILKNRLTETISLLSIEQDMKKKENLEIQYNELLKEIKMI
ncbi:MAG: ribosomal protection-like ABC-F family protein [Clostridium sp.]